MMAYTCEDCKKQCYERSRQYPCREFQLGKVSAKEMRKIRNAGNKGKKENRPVKKSDD